MAARESVSLSLQADISDLKRSLGEIPGVTKREAAKMTRELQTQYNKAQRAAQKAAKATKVSWADTARSAAMVGTALTGAAVAVVAFGQSMADLNNELTDTATRTGLLVEQVAGLRLAGQGSGVEFAKLENGLNRLPKAMADAAKGTGSAADAFKRLGIEVQDADTGALRDASDVFAEITTELGSMDDAALKSATAMEIFGTKAGGALVQSGALENLDAFVALATEFGVDVGPKATQAAADFQREMALLRTVSQGVAQDLLEQFGGAGGLNDVLRTATEGVVLFGAVFGSTFDSIADAYGKVLGPIAEVAASLAEGDFAGALEAAKRNGLEFGEGLLRTTNMVGLAATVAEGAIDGVAEGLERVQKLRKLVDATGTPVVSGAAPGGADTGAAPKGETAAKVDERIRAFERLRQQQAASAEARLSELQQIEMAFSKQVELIPEAQAAGVEAAEIDAALDDAKMDRMEALRVMAERSSAERIAQMEAEAETQRRTLMATVGASGEAAAAIGDVFGVASAAFAEGSTEASQKAAKALFVASQAAAGATIGLRVAEGLMVAATLPPPADNIKRAAVIAQGVASAAAIATAQPPTFDRGGIIMGGTGDQVNARVLPGESVLNRTATQSLGTRMIEELNTNDGRSMGGMGRVVNVWKGRVYDDFVTDTREARFSPVYGG